MKIDEIKNQIIKSLREAEINQKVDEAEGFIKAKTQEFIDENPEIVKTKKSKIKKSKSISFSDIPFTPELDSNAVEKAKQKATQKATQIAAIQKRAMKHVSLDEDAIRLLEDSGTDVTKYLRGN